MPKRKQYRLILDSRSLKYGGSHEVPEVYRAVKKECDGQPFSIGYELPHMERRCSGSEIRGCLREGKFI